MNLPNKLTVLRVVMIPFFLLTFFWKFSLYHMLIALVIFAVASLTDMLDGKIARKNNLVTSFGKLMDPLADKLLVTAAMVCVLGYAYPRLLPGKHAFYILCLIISISRDLIVNSIRLIAASEGTVIAADIFGKLKTVFQMVWLCFAMLEMGIDISLSTGIGVSRVSYGTIKGLFQGVNSILFWCMMIMTVLSGLNYVIKNKSVFADA